MSTRPSDCYEENEQGTCSRSVSAKEINNKYLVLDIGDYVYYKGTPHGHGSSKTIIYRKTSDGWDPIESKDLFDSSKFCTKLISTALYRKLKPLRLSRVEENGWTAEDLFNDATVSLDAQGVIFYYEQYALGAYAEGPRPVLIPYESLGKCLVQ